MHSYFRDSTLDTRGAVCGSPLIKVRAAFQTIDVLYPGSNSFFNFITGNL